MERISAALDTSGILNNINVSVSIYIRQLQSKRIIPCSYFFYRLNKKLQLFYVFAACRKGYQGIHCKDRCTFPFYGSDCQFECKCVKEDCHYAEGCKQTYKAGILTDLSCLMYTLYIAFVDHYALYKICYKKSLM